MRKSGKPNTFLKGMQMDMDPLLQPKDTYRYAKNIRLASYQGQNISIHPYNSDKPALILSAGTLSVGTSTSISNVANWLGVSQSITGINSYSFF